LGLGIDFGLNFYLDNIQISNSSAGNSKLIDISRTTQLSVNVVRIEGIKEYCFTIVRWESYLFMNLNLKGWLKAINMRESTIKISESRFLNNGDTNNMGGGSISMLNSNLQVSNSSFVNNTAAIGGAIGFKCTSTLQCGLSLTNTTFTNNSATQEGGCIYYNYKRPSLLNITQQNSSAPYGSFIASYPVKIRIEGAASDQIEINNIGSGIRYPQILKLSLLDVDDQVMIQNNINQIIITPLDSTNSSILGFNSQLLKSGVSSFNNIIAVASPGKQNVKYQANWKAIDKTLISEVYGGQISDNLITMNFRYCQPGEMKLGNTSCSEWAAGTYSLFWNSTSCISWLANTVWLGKEVISVNPRYWRRTTNSTMIVECQNGDACKGGYFKDKEHPVECASGYEGNLWSKCSLPTIRNNKSNGEKYMKVGNFKCQRCPDPLMNAIRVIGVGLLVFGFFMMLISINVRKTKESELSVLLRIMTNYLQLLTTSLSFSTSFPTSLTDLFLPVKSVGSSSDTFLSFDCFARDSELKGPFPSTAFLKLALSGLLPIMIFLLVALIWLIVRWMKKSFVPNMERYLAISFISILFLLHPKLTEQSLGVFEWVDIDNGIRKASIDTDLDWYSKEHLKWCLGLGVPILVIWILGLPLVALFLMSRNIKNEDSKVSKYFLILYQGLRRKHFYWEFINSSRKIAILLIFSQMKRFDAFTAVIVLTITFRIQVAIQPYKDSHNNEVEILAVLAGMMTIASGVIFSTAESEATLNLLILIVVILFNVKFIFEWIYLLFICMSHKYEVLKKIAVFLSIILMKKKVT